MRIEFGHAVAKGFARCIATLARIGDDVFIEVLPNGVMLLYTVNLARTAFGKVALLASFFDHYETGSQSPRHFKVLLKTMTTIFKSKAAYIDLIEKVRFRIQEAPTDRLVVELHCKHGVKKIFQLHYQTTDPQKAAFSKSACTSMFSASPKIIQDWLAFFSYKLDEVSIGCTLVDDDDGTGDLGGRKVVIRSFSDDIMGATQVSQPEADPTKRSLATEISVDYEDFDTFDVFSDVEITFSLKDLKTALSFADNIGQCINAHFIGPGQPIILSTSQENIYSADFVLATNSVGSSTQASTTVKTSASGTSNRTGTAKSFSSTNSTQTTKNPPRISTPFQTSRKQSQSQTQTPQSTFKPFLGGSSSNTTTRKTNHGAMDQDTDDETPLFSQAASQSHQQGNETPVQQPSSSAHQRLSEIKKRRRESQIAATQSPLTNISKRDLLFDESVRISSSHSNATTGSINVPPTLSHESRPSGQRSSKGSHVSGTMRSTAFEQDDEEEDEVPLHRPIRGGNQSIAITQKLSLRQPESLFGSAEKASSSFSSFMMDSGGGGGDSKKRDLQVAFSVAGVESTVAPENNDAFFDQQDDDMTVDDWNYVIRASQEAEDEETLKLQRRQRLESHVNEEEAGEDDDDEVIPPSPEGGFVDLEASRLIVPNYRLSGSDFQRVGGQGSGNRGSGGMGKNDLVQKVGHESFMHSFGGSVGQSGDGEFDAANEPPRLGNSGIMRPVSDYASRFQFSQSQASQSRVQRADEGFTEFDYEGGADPTPAKSPHVSRQYQGRPSRRY